MISVVLPVDEARLPRGPHRLTREEVAGSQRWRIGVAALQTVAENGYHATTVADIVKRAKVSRRTFYELFPSKDACFIAAFEVCVDFVDAQLSSALRSDTRLGWRDLVRQSLTSYLRIIAAEPAFASALHIETIAAGPPLVAARSRMLSVFAARMRAVCELAVAAGDVPGMPPDEVFDFMVGGIDERVRYCLQHSGPEALLDLEPLFYSATIALFGATGS
ncbi:TetR/AcrR family transcriptional regulator [Antrihabitans stalactiti]|uniref:TetR/AcrR family transcriptional regulator n=1 Tax=Antrihabitans stalactiti TaxID=2584121 RepID=UPI0030B7FC0D